MLKSLKRAAITAGAAATIVAIGAATAQAATFTVKIGTTATGSGTYTAASQGSVQLTDTTTGVVVTCTTASAAGAVPHLGSGLNSPLATITSTVWNSCSGAGLTFTVAQTGTWSINGTSYSSASGGVTTGNITGISATLTASGCSFKVAGATTGATGSTDGTFTNTGTNAQILSVAPVSGSGHVLTISNVSGCFGVVANGHTASFVGKYLVSAKTSAGGAGALTITSP